MKKLAVIFSSIILISASLSAQIVNGVAKGTIVTLADGVEVSIEEIKVGDLLLTMNAENHTIAVSKVKSVHEASAQEVTKVTLADGTEIAVSLAQTILSDKGWTALNPLLAKEQAKNASVKIGECKLDNFVFSVGADMKIAMLPIIDIEPVSTSGSVYALELDSPNVAYIASGVFVGQ